MVQSFFFIFYFLCTSIFLLISIIRYSIIWIQMFWFWVSFCSTQGFLWSYLDRWQQGNKCWSNIHRTTGSEGAKICDSTWWSCEGYFVFFFLSFFSSFLYRQPNSLFASFKCMNAHDIYLDINLWSLLLSFGSRNNHRHIRKELSHTQMTSYWHDCYHMVDKLKWWKYACRCTCGLSHVWKKSGIWPMKAIFPLCFIIAADYVTWLKWSCEGRLLY